MHYRFFSKNQSIYSLRSVCTLEKQQHEKRKEKSLRNSNVRKKKNGKIKKKLR